MDASERVKECQRASVGEWLSRPIKWQIPVYQRHYSWDAADESGPIHLLWETIEDQTNKRLEGKNPPAHYLGAVLVESKTPSVETERFTFDVVDGQQRLTTIQIALLALIKIVDKHKWGNDIKTELGEYVFLEGGPRLFPTNFDRPQFQRVLYEGSGMLYGGVNTISDENADRSKIISAFEFFKKQYSALLKKSTERHEEGEIVRAIKETLTRGFDLVQIVLRKDDRAQEIFESLNNYAKPLTIFDLVRNNVFYRAGDSSESLFNNEVWQQLEDTYWEGKAGKGQTHIESYLLRSLVARSRANVRFNRHDILKRYKEFAKEFDSVEEEVRTLVEYVPIYRYLDSGEGTTPLEGTQFNFFRYGVTHRDFYPVIFRIVRCDKNKEQKRRMIKLLESYLVRREVCGLTKRNQNLLAANICAQLGDEPSYDALRVALISRKGDSGVFPNDERVKSDCEHVQFYGSVLQRYIFDKIEISMHRPGAERVVVDRDILTIDHILPQGWEENNEWRQMVLSDGVHTEGDANFCLPTIGNLTLMSRSNNSRKSNRPLEEVKGLLEEGVLLLNRELANETTWGVGKIRERSRTLAARICKVWPDDILDEVL